ncbi:MAG: spore coat U domain-containing protein [Vannielia sp.]|uniref:Csu type fimbrial protein n=1 Tax=Vannielia sp. TaxID=2813045 RepID=UPI003B8B6B70
MHLIPRTLLRAAVVVAGLVMAPLAASAANCTATVTDFNFGTVSLRTGALNQTQGNVRISCTNPLLDAVGVCLRVGSGSGGAGGGNSPRYMRGPSGQGLAYELRLGGASAVNGTLTEAYFLVPIVLGLGGTIDVPIYGQITSAAPGVPTGSYSSQFSGAPDIQLTYGVLACGLLGQNYVPPDFSVRAQVEASCEVSVGSLSFGIIDSQVSRPVDQTANLTVRCSQAAAYSITLDQGQGGGSDPKRRRMKNGSHVLEYGLYHDPARSSVWGTTAANDKNATGAGLDQTYTIFGRIHAGQMAQFGTYSDSVVVTVNY